MWATSGVPKPLSFVNFQQTLLPVIFRFTVPVPFAGPAGVSFFPSRYASNSRVLALEPSATAGTATAITATNAIRRRRTTLLLSTVLPSAAGHTGLLVGRFSDEQQDRL